MNSLVYMQQYFNLQPAKAVFEEALTSRVFVARLTQVRKYVTINLTQSSEVGVSPQHPYLATYICTYVDQKTLHH